MSQERQEVLVGACSLLEVNGKPQRLDIKADDVRFAVQHGVRAWRVTS